MKKVSKEILEIINSLSWLLMDAMWMLNELEFSYAFIIPTVFSGFWLLFKEDKFDGFLVAFAALMWSVMNSIWLIGETLNMPGYLVACKIGFLLGVSSLVTGLLLSKDITKTLGAFKRFKVKVEKPQAIKEIIR
jgi:hypothetical protein